MSTLNVANISDDQSTLTGSNTNLDDRLHFNKTVDTKFVTNGCAKAWAANGQDLISNSMNCSSIDDLSTGRLEINYTTSFSSENYGLGTTAQYRRSVYQNSQGAGSIQYFFTDPHASEVTGVDLGNVGNACVWAAHGDLA